MSCKRYVGWSCNLCLPCFPDFTVLLSLHLMWHHGYKAVGHHGYNAAWHHGYKAVWHHRYRALNTIYWGLSTQQWNGTFVPRGRSQRVAEKRKYRYQLYKFFGWWQRGHNASWSCININLREREKVASCREEQGMILECPNRHAIQSSLWLTLQAFLPVQACKEQVYKLLWMKFSS